MTETTMTDARILEAAGWDQAEIDSYFAACDRRRYYGYDSLTVDQKKLVLRAKGAPAKVAEAKAANKIRAIGRQPVQSKLHYRWVVVEKETLTELVEVAPGEVSAFAIFKDEVIKALEVYQPILSRVDTIGRFKFIPLEGEMLEIAAAIGRVADFDRQEFIARMAVEFPDDYRPEFYTNWGSDDHPYGAVISESDVEEFRGLVRGCVEKMTREVYPTALVN